MKNTSARSAKELYQELRTRSIRQLWEQDMPLFDKARPEEREQLVGLIRAAGVVFSESGTDAEKELLRKWLHGLLSDPSEKIRRYAMTALPKIGAGQADEAALLRLLQNTESEREKRFLGETLDKIGGRATLEILSGSDDEEVLARTARKVKANVARTETPSTVRMDRQLEDIAGVRIHLRCREGLEEIVRDEVRQRSKKNGGLFRILDVFPGLVALEPVRPFSMRDLYAHRCFATLGFVSGETTKNSPEDSVEALARIVSSPIAQRILTAFTDGAIRYRLEFIAKGHQRGTVRQITDRAYELCPALLNDARLAPWAMDIYPRLQGGGETVEIRPRLSPDPRLAYRLHDVPAASHPPLAACIARLAGPVAAGESEMVWDPFCGSGLELIERGLLGGVKALFGTDLSTDAASYTRANIKAAALKGIDVSIVACDFRDAARLAGITPGLLTLVITNPPMGKRVRIPNLPQMIQEVFHAAATALKPGGRLVIVNPVFLQRVHPLLRLESRRPVDMGGFTCHLEKYIKLAETIGSGPEQKKIR